MTELAAFAKQLELHAGDDAIALADGQRDGRALHLDDVTGDAGEQRHDLVHDRLQRRGRGGGRLPGGGLGPRKRNAAEDRQENGQRDERSSTASLHSRHYITVPRQQRGPEVSPRARRYYANDSTRS